LAARLAELPVLRVHRRRCAGEDRRVLAQRARRAVRRLARDAYRRGVEGDGSAAARELVGLFTANPWQATALRYWVKLQARA
jgi:hypothetical protein